MTELLQNQAAVDVLLSFLRDAANALNDRKRKLSAVGATGPAWAIVRKRMAEAHGRAAQVYLDEANKLRRELRGAA